ncbi:MAG: nucleotidyltransferase family protein [Actinomycetota bacterium]
MLGVVLSAGRGTRMRPLSTERPKPLIPTLDIPLVSWALERLRLAGVDHAWVNAHEAAADVGAEVGRRDRGGMRVSLLHERETPLGTAGTLRALRAQLTEPFLVVNVDVATNLTLERLVDAHRSGRGAGTLLGVATDEVPDLVVEEAWVAGLVDRHGEKGEMVAQMPGAGEVLHPHGVIYGGVGVFEPEVLEWIPGGTSGLFETVFRTALVRDRGLAVFEWDGYWVDVGSPRDHLRANLDALGGILEAAPVEGLLAERQRWDALAFVAAEAEADGAELRHCIVGRGARVDAGARLERCVVWSGAAVGAGDYRDAVITPQRIVTTP